MSSPASALKLENVLYEKKGPIAYVTINRPKVLNALNAKTISELRSTFEDARDDSEVRGVVFTGAGTNRLRPARTSANGNDTPLTAETENAVRPSAYGPHLKTSASRHRCCEWFLRSWWLSTAMAASTIE